MDDKADATTPGARANGQEDSSTDMGKLPQLPTNLLTSLKANPSRNAKRKACLLAAPDEAKALIDAFGAAIPEDESSSSSSSSSSSTREPSPPSFPNPSPGPPPPVSPVVQGIVRKRVPPPPPRKFSAPSPPHSPPSSSSLDSPDASPSPLKNDESPPATKATTTAPPPRSSSFGSGPVKLSSPSSSLSQSAKLPTKPVPNPLPPVTKTTPLKPSKLSATSSSSSSSSQSPVDSSSGSSSRSSSPLKRDGSPVEEPKLRHSISLRKSRPMLRRSMSQGNIVGIRDFVEQELSSREGNRLSRRLNEMNPNTRTSILLSRISSGVGDLMTSPPIARRSSLFDDSTFDDFAIMMDQDFSSSSSPSSSTFTDRVRSIRSNTQATPSSAELRPPRPPRARAPTEFGAGAAAMARMSINSSKKERMRLMAVEELINSEQDYVRDLGIIASVFLEPIRQKKIIKPAEISRLFSNVEVLIGVNTLLLNDLLWKVEDYGLGECPVGMTFLQLGNFLKTYTSYVSNHSASIECYTNLIKQNAQFAAILKTCMENPECRGLDLMSFLVKPIQRLCKYPLLIRGILLSTNEAHPDYENLSNAFAEVEIVATYVNEAKRQQENQIRVMEICQNLVGIELSELLTPTRRFVCEADFVKISKGRAQERHFFLFNDVIIYGRAINRKKDQYQFKDMLRLEWTVCNDLPGPASDIESKHGFRFELMRLDQKMKKYIICASDLQTKKAWIKMIMEQHYQTSMLKGKKPPSDVPNSPSLTPTSPTSSPSVTPSSSSSSSSSSST